MSYLLIGGKADGRRIEVCDGLDRIIVPSLPGLNCGQEPQQPTNTTIEFQEPYKLHRVIVPVGGGSGRYLEFSYYGHEDLHPAEVFERLLSGYRGTE